MPKPYRMYGIMSVSAIACLLLMQLVSVPGAVNGSVFDGKTGDAPSGSTAVVYLPWVSQGYRDMAQRSNLQESIVFKGLDQPTAVRFARDGRVFVAQKNGIIKVFAGLAASTATVFADLRTEVNDFYERGLLGLALDPNFPTNPYVYVLYTFDAPIGGAAPHWNDVCPNPPGGLTDGCVVSGRLARLTVDAGGDAMAPGSEKVLLNGWCQQFPSHSIGQLAFGPDGALYVSGGDGANFYNVDYGQYGNTNADDQANPCGDPPAGVGGNQSAPSAQGGALRSQSLGRSPGEPGGPQRRDPACRPCDRASLAYQPLVRQSGRQCTTHRRVRVAQPLPLYLSPGHR